MMTSVQWIEAISIVLAIAATFYLFAIASKTAERFRLGFVVLGIGILIPLGFHSALFFLSSFGYIVLESSVRLMALELFIGAILVMIGVYWINNELGKITKIESK